MTTFAATPENAATFAGRVAGMHRSAMRNAARSRGRLASRHEANLALAQKVIGLDRLSKAAIETTRAEAGRPGADLAGLYRETAEAREAMRRMVAWLDRHPRLFVLRPLFEEALIEWDDLAEELYLPLDAELHRLLSRLEDVVDAHPQRDKAISQHS